MKRNFRPRRGMIVLAVAGLALLLAPSLFAHDFWLVPNAFRLVPGEVLEVNGQTSSRFPTSEAAVDPTRIAEARVLSAADDEDITDVSTRGSSLVLRHRPTRPGQRVISYPCTRAP